MSDQGVWLRRTDRTHIGAGHDRQIQAQQHQVERAQRVHQVDGGIVRPLTSIAEMLGPASRTPQHTATIGVSLGDQDTRAQSVRTLWAGPCMGACIARCRSPSGPNAPNGS